MYSLGLILFDLIYPMKTLMEKHNLFEEIKKGNLPQIIKDRLPLISKLLSSLINDDSASRPRAKEIIVLLTEYLNQYDNLNGLNCVKTNSPLKKRKRYLSEDIQKIKSQEMLMKINEVSGNIYWKYV